MSYKNVCCLKNTIGWNKILESIVIDDETLGPTIDEAEVAV